MANDTTLSNLDAFLPQALFDMGADIISTDTPAGLRAFVTSRAVAAAPRRPLLRWRVRSTDVVVRRLFWRRGVPPKP